MKEFQAEIVRREGQTLFGVQKTSADRQQRTDVPMMIRLYARLTGKDISALDTNPPGKGLSVGQGFVTK